MLAVVLFGVVFAAVAPAAPGPTTPTPTVASTPPDGLTPTLEIHAPEGLEPLAQRLAKLDPEAMRRTVRLVGLDAPGPPIPVILAREGSPAANVAPNWSVAYATHGGQIVLMPTRVPGYPNKSLETVLLHEIAHVLIDRAAAHEPVPRWFHEGLALYAAREWGLEDRSRLLWATIRGHGSTLGQLDDSFTGGAYRARRAYSFSGAFTRFLVERYGPETPGTILAGLAAGRGFDGAFNAAVGMSLVGAEESFFRQLDLWNKWIPVLTSSATLWILITMLFLWAFKRRRDRDAEILARWDQEEERAWLKSQPTDGLVN